MPIEDWNFIPVEAEEVPAEEVKDVSKESKRAKHKRSTKKKKVVDAGELEEARPIESSVVRKASVAVWRSP